MYNRNEPSNKPNSVFKTNEKVKDLLGVGIQSGNEQKKAIKDLKKKINPKGKKHEE